MSDKKRYPANTQLSKEENDMLVNMLEYEKSLVRKILGEESANKAVTQASFMRSLIVKEYKRRSRKFKQLNNGKTGQ